MCPSLATFEMGTSRPWKETVHKGKFEILRTRVRRQEPFVRSHVARLSAARETYHGEFISGCSEWNTPRREWVSKSRMVAGEAGVGQIPHAASLAPKQDPARGRDGERETRSGEARTDRRSGSRCWASCPQRAPIRLSDLWLLNKA